MKKFTKPIASFISGLIILEVLYFMYLAFWPFKVVSVKQPLHVVTKVVHPGGNLVYTVEYCKYGDYPATVVRTIFCTTKDGQQTSLQYPASGSITLPGCRKTNVVIPIPVSATEGVCTLVSKPTYQVNIIRQYGITSTSEPFTIRK